MTDSDKIDKILESVSDMKTELAKSIVHQEVHNEQLKEHDVAIKDLIALKNKGIGISIIGGTALGSFFTYLFKHF